MKESSKRRLAFACCATMALAFSACSNDSDVTEATDACAKCTADQTCENGTCVDKPVEDPCAKCTAD